MTYITEFITKHQWQIQLYAIALLFIWNFIVFLTYRADKRRSLKKKWRISEKTLLLMGLCMGSVGAIAGCNVFHHKTKVLKFRVLLPLFVVLNLSFIVLIWYLVGRF